MNGAGVSSTPTGTGATAGPISFRAGEADVVRMCAVTDAHGPAVRCDVSTTQPIPPDEVRHVIEWLVIGNPEGLCGDLRQLAGNYDPVVIGSDGDIYVDGEPFWDCPPYQHWPPE